MEETIWINQSLLNFKDEEFLSNGKLSVYITFNIDDNFYFNSPCFGISVTNERRKNCILNIQHAEDLLESIETAIKQVNGVDIVIEKIYNKKVKLYIKFEVISSTNDRVVIIELISNEYDSTKIIIPLKPTFQSFIRRLKSFVINYDNICYSLLTSSLNNESRKIIKRLPDLIKGISLQVTPVTSNEIIDGNNQLNTNDKIDEETIKETENNILDFNKFIGDDMSNIKIDEIDKSIIEPVKKPVEINSKFVTNILKNNLINLENKLILYSRSKNSIKEMLNDLESKLDLKLLDGITDTELKAVIYISTLYKEFYIEKYLYNQEFIPEFVPSLKFIGNNNLDNIEIAKDIFVFACYFRAIKRKLELKESDVFINKSMIYFLIRILMDVISVSYLDKISSDELLSTIKIRYEYYDSIGVFNEYKILLSEYNCKEITLNDIYSLANDYLKSKELNNNKKISIEDTYKSLDLILPINNEYNIEQIIKEIIPLEVNKYFGNDITNEKISNKLKEKYNISDDIMNLFKNKIKEKSKNEFKKITPLERWIKKFKQDIPEAYRDDVLEYVKNMEYKTFDFKNSPWPLDEFDDRIVKALYLWNVEINPKIKTSFEEFASLIEDEIMTKESILLINKKETKNNIIKETSNDWNSIENLI
jgi:hypothetical protein